MKNPVKGSKISKIQRPGVEPGACRDFLQLKLHCEAAVTFIGNRVMEGQSAPRRTSLGVAQSLLTNQLDHPCESIDQRCVGGLGCTETSLDLC